MAEMIYDTVIVGAGTAGIPAAIFAAQRGGRVCLIEHAPDVGGCLLINRGQMSAAGTRLQAERGIIDSPELHYQDAIRISRGTTDRDFLKMAVKLQGPFFDWLMDNGFEVHDDMPRIIHGHEAYAVARTYWGKDDGRSILKVLKPLLDAEIAAGRVALHLNTAVEDLIIADDGAVAGVVTESGARFLGRSTVLTTGGYAANPEMFARFHQGAKLWSGAYFYAQGKGIELGLKAGGVVDHADKYMPGFGGILDHTLPAPRYRSMGGLTPQDRPQWEIVVNKEGQRFYAEDGESVDERSLALQRQTDGRAWVIYDEAIRRDAPSIFHYFTKTKEADFYRNSDCVKTADSLADLAAICGIDWTNLQATVADYNEGVQTGVDALGRQFMPRKIAEGPFYALEIYSYAVRSFGGLKVDHDFKVLDGAGAPIANLYAVGEILGSVLSGNGAVGGMSLTPALVFGRLLGERILPLANA